MPLEILVFVKVSASLAFSTTIAGASGFILCGERTLTNALRAGGLTTLALVVLVRGAPHNNPVVYTVFEQLGTVGLVLLCLASLGGGAALGWHLAGSRHAESTRSFFDGSRLSHGIIVMAVLAALAALESVIRFWDVPGWGDAIFWDRIAHLIARGDMPAGHSYYMPAFQYGSAFLYWAFGHYFFVAQLANVIWAPVTVVALSLAARHVPLSGWGVLLVGALAATHDYVRYMPHIMQIENWYIPILATGLWLALRWQVRPSIMTACGIGLMAGLAFSTRTQGAFFDALLLTSPLLLSSRATIGRRILASAIASLIFVTTITPWTIRNYVVENRIAIMGTQGPEHMAFATDPRTFYGIRRDLGAAEVSAEWRQRYPDQSERELAMSRHVVAHFFADPLYSVQGIWWRSLAFYGLLPDGILAQGGPMPTDWIATGKIWLMRNLATLSILFAAILGLVLRRDRVAFLLFAGVIASMAPVLVVGFTEARIHYPVLLLLFLAAAAGLGRGRPDDVGARGGPLWWQATPSIRRAGARAGLLTLCLVIGVGMGRVGPLYRPVTEPGIRLDPAMPAGNGPPDASQAFIDAKLTTGRHAPENLADGAIRLRLAITNHHLPVKWYAEKVRGFPSFASDPSLPIYYRGYVVTAEGGYDWGASPVVAVRLHGAQFDRHPLEDDIVEIDGRVRYVSEVGMAFVDASIGRVERRSFPLRQELRREDNE